MSEILTSDDLVTIMEDEVVAHCVLWEAVGLVLGLNDAAIKKIVNFTEPSTIINFKFYKTPDDYKREMFSALLKKAGKLTMNEIRDAVNRVNQREKREDNMKKISKGERDAIQAIRTLLKVLDEWEELNEELYSNRQHLQCELQKENKWMQEVSKDQWKLEDRQWEDEGDENKFKQAIDMGRNYKNSPFVQAFLRGKQLDPSQLDDAVILGMLRQGLVEILIVRGRKLQERYRLSLKHHKITENLKKEIEDLEERIKARLKAYDTIKVDLEKIGSKKENNEKLNNQMERLTSELKEYHDIKQHFEEAVSQMQQGLSHTESDLKGCLASLEQTVKLMENDQITFMSLMKQVLSVAVAVVGAAAGTAIVPVIGTFIGGVAGFVLGRRATRALVDTQITNYKDSIVRGRDLLEQLKDIELKAHPQS